MPEKLPGWADLLLTVWVAVVGVIFFGVYVDPRIGLWTDAASGFYTLMVLASAGMLAAKYLRRDTPPPPKSGKRPPGKRRRP